MARWDAHLLGINITKSCSLKKACCSAWAVLQQPADALDPRHHGQLIVELPSCRGAEHCRYTIHKGGGRSQHSRFDSQISLLLFFPRLAKRWAFEPKPGQNSSRLNQRDQKSALGPVLRADAARTLAIWRIVAILDI